MSDKSARVTTGETVRRSYSAQFEVRGKSGSTVEVRGYATVYDEPYSMWDAFGPYTEVMRSGSGKKTLAEGPQVQLLLNHGGLSMAYTKAGTLRLAEDSTGLETLATLNTARNDVHDMVVAMEDGDIDEMSFAFRVMRQDWSPDFEQRDILEYNIHRGDVSVVNFGANPATAVAMRAADFDLLDDADARELYERLGARLATPEPQRPLSLFLAELDLARHAPTHLG